MIGLGIFIAIVLVAILLWVLFGRSDRSSTNGAYGGARRRRSSARDEDTATMSTVRRRGHRYGPLVTASGSLQEDSSSGPDIPVCYLAPDPSSHRSSRGTNSRHPY